jgi:hypothetical protein
MFFVDVVLMVVVMCCCPQFAVKYGTTNHEEEVVVAEIRCSPVATLQTNQTPSGLENSKCIAMVSVAHNVGNPTFPMDGLKTMAEFPYVFRAVGIKSDAFWNDPMPSRGI